MLYRCPSHLDLTAQLKTPRRESPGLVGFGILKQWFVGYHIPHGPSPLDSLQLRSIPVPKMADNLAEWHLSQILLKPVYPTIQRHDLGIFKHEDIPPTFRNSAIRRLRLPPLKPGVSWALNM